MTSLQWQDLQTALLWTFGPLLGWGLSGFVALGFGAAMWVIWLGLLRWLSRAD